MRRSSEKQNRSALRIALIYAVVSALWILFSDLLVAGIRNPRLITILSIAKGWGFVLVTAVLLYLLVRDAIQRIYRSEAQMALIFDSVNDGITIFYFEDERPSCFIAVNDAATRSLGYTRDEFMRMTPIDLVKPELRPEAWETMRTLHETGRAVLETCVVTSDGRDVPVELSARTVAVNGRMMAITIARDITERLRIERERRDAAVAAERDKRHFYRETILAVTGGKFELADPAEAETWVRNPDIAIHVADPEEMADARHEILEYCRRAGMIDESVQEFELGIGEALGNAVKHAGEGWLYAGRDTDSVWVAVVDHGTGIETFMIPKVALLAGFTTKASMGLGYTLILRSCDHVKLATGPDGTTVVMQKLLKPQSELDSRLSVFAGIE